VTPPACGRRSKLKLELKLSYTLPDHPRLQVAVDSICEVSTKKRAQALSFVRLLIIASLMVSATTIFAATYPPGFHQTFVAAGLSAKTAMAFAPDGRLFVCLQTGQIRVIKNGTLLPDEFMSITVDPSGERGLLGIAFDPNFSVIRPYVYIYYTVPGSPAHNRVSRLSANGDLVQPNSELQLLNLENLSLTATNHNGGALNFGPDGKLYVAVGDNADGTNSQTLANRLGKILRINDNGTIPSDNPFVGVVGANPAIWALGLRNPYSFAFQPGTGRMFINDVGQSTFEEINLGVAGSNYRWPNCEGPCSPPVL